MKIINLNKIYNIKRNDKNNSQAFKNNKSSDCIYVKQSKYEAVKIPAAIAILFGQTLLENDKTELKQKFNNFKNKTGGKLNLVLLCVGSLLLVASCIHSHINEKDKEKDIILKIKKEKKENDNTTLKKYFFKKAMFEGCLCSTLNIAFSFFNIKKVGNKTCEKVLGYGVGTGFLWMGLSLLVNKLTLDKFKKEKK